MPAMDGLVATAETRRRLDGTIDDHGRLPIIALTASAMEEDRERCRDPSPPALQAARDIALGGLVVSRSPSHG
jgi:CheY-like chemotaxis protein